jgi:phage protein D
LIGSLLLHPAYKIQIGQLKLVPNESEGEVTGIAVEMSMDAPSNLFEGFLRVKEQGLEFDKGDSVIVSLGYDEDTKTDVFKGSIHTLSSKFSRVSVYALSSMSNLCSLHIDRFYEQQTAGAVIKDLARTVGVSLDEVADGIHLPYYAVSSKKNAYEHIRDLAQDSGFDTYFTNEDKLVFKKYDGTKKHTLEYGKDILNIVKTDQKDQVQSVKVVGESPSSTKGADTSHWLTKQQVKGTASGSARGTGGGARALGGSETGSGSGSSQVLVQNRLVRDTETASKVAEANLARLESTTNLLVEIVGSSKIMLGHGVKIEKMPDKLLNGEYQVRTVEHYLSKSSGFITTLRCRGVKLK